MEHTYYVVVLFKAEGRQAVAATDLTTKRSLFTLDGLAAGQRTLAEHFGDPNLIILNIINLTKESEDAHQERDPDPAA